ncbi:MAG: short-chain dehydrogenase [Zetaproteobacteria bacterium CG06_land_8_20_14_3_00_59_53]|nr:MAG: short-chain dehydrogenase [Zetaproteobacteria bacterium CG2_30_59_37]PIO89893.1 MAG: short-chain dehydrogenase [Zetaproteobacteria bacterium CG23_combo_of_CG06-09_8_20_14_all_59_86]PIQ64258.1 MAG: short-chain dehydrogenase [Zetaproteobacteria bacterium CG11_big_fil_rev_8_21_14_0_20_59_439]PIU70396.1 MAG: short-chain dehydrogenase [Zetaproteobacteria bacterium CG06_land_8_20_14_3_00_59_53]PIU97480.1 MAG: short-chain dehydrogenase [Zetaproteobacteria bacterium CG03_land_8_20_14_0_80_59_51
MSSIKEMMNLKGRRALITGAGGNLGRVIADTLAEIGADLALVDRSGTDLQGQSDALQQRWGNRVYCYHCDLEQQEQRNELVRQLKDDGEGLNILINNAAFVGTSGLQGWSVPFEEQSVETWRRALEVNLTAVFDLCQGLAPMLRRSEGASIINIASIYGQYGPDWGLYEGTGMSNPAAYGASKGGLIQLTRWLATTLAPDVRVNAISPGGIFRNQPEPFVRRYAARTPLSRMGTEDDMRGSVAYLASDLSNYVTGQNLAVDGGWGIW